MIKIKRKNYLEERAQERYENNINNQFKNSGAFSNDKSDNKWRGKDNQNSCLNSAEDNYQLKQILKGYQKSQDELNGYNSKYINQLTDLLSRKDKNFTRKRLELYINRINNKETIFNNYNDKSKDPYKTISTINSRLNRMFKPRKSQLLKKHTSNTLKKGRIYYKTISNFYPISLKDNNNYFKYKMRNRNKLAESIISSQLRKNDDDSFDHSLKGKEGFLMTGDRDKYKEFLQKEYKFFVTPDINQIIYTYEKNQRMKNFKNIQNSQFLELRKSNSYKYAFLNKIKRNKKKIKLNFDDIFKNNCNKISDEAKNNENSKKNNKINFIMDCKKILFKVKNNII
jgi:hypothetical protein